MNHHLSFYQMFVSLVAQSSPWDAEKVFAGSSQDVGSLFNFNPYNLLAGLIFGTIGWGAFVYGKRLDLWQPRVIGIALMVYPYVFTNAWLLWGVGVALMVLLWFYHNE